MEDNGIANHGCEGAGAVPSTALLWHLLIYSVMGWDGVTV
jgi:hypothetical protein